MSQHPVCDDVIVVGAGLNGLMVALTLAEAGVAVHLIDRHDGVFEGDTIRTTTINPASYQHFDALGLWNAYRAGGAEPTPIMQIRVSDEKTKPQPGRIVADSLIDWRSEGEGEANSGPGDGPLAYTFNNRRMTECLYQSVVRHAAITVTSGCAITDYAPRHPDLGDAAAMVSTDDKQNFAARLIVAADGGQSPLRHAAGIKGITRRPGQTAIVADIVSERPHHMMAWQRFIPGGPAALMPIDQNRRHALVWTMKDDDAHTLLAAEPLAFNTALMESFGQGLGALTLDSDRLSWPLELHHVMKPYTTRMVLVGDAAHRIHPLAGQGYNLGVGDALALAEVIASARQTGQDIGARHILRRYGQKRVLDVTAMTVMTDGLNAAFSFGGPVVAGITGMGMTLFGASPLKKLAEKFARR